MLFWSSFRIVIFTCQFVILPDTIEFFRIVRFVLQFFESCESNLRPLFSFGLFLVCYWFVMGICFDTLSRFKMTTTGYLLWYLFRFWYLFQISFWLMYLINVRSSIPDPFLQITKLNKFWSRSWYIHFKNTCKLRQPGSRRPAFIGVMIFVCSNGNKNF